MSGTTKLSARLSTYPGTKNHMMEMPVSTRIMASPSDTATPMDSAAFMALAGIEPAVISSTCLFSTWTAGSACTMK